MRVPEGAFKTKSDKNGAEYDLHRLDGAVPPPSAPPPPVGPAPDRADADALHRVYSALLTRLQLSEVHREALRRRGLGDDEIDRRGYRTLPVRGRAALARALRQEFGDSLLSVPGFVVKQGMGAKPYVTLAGAAGTLGPVRDLAGRAVALLARRDDASDGRGKSQYLSSTAADDPGPGAPVHVPLGVAGPAEVVRVTEGALKSDLAHVLSGVPTIGLPGVSTWRPALPMLRELGARTVRLAFDMDAQDKPTVARPLAALAEALCRRGKPKLIALSCHYDIVDWLDPDWVYNTTDGGFTRRSLPRRPPRKGDAVSLPRTCTSARWRTSNRSASYWNGWCYTSERCKAASPPRRLGAGAMVANGGQFVRG
jgi:hypothetical protein